MSILSNIEAYAARNKNELQILGLASEGQLQENDLKKRKRAVIEKMLTSLYG